MNPLSSYSTPAMPAYCQACQEKQKAGKLTKLAWMFCISLLTLMSLLIGISAGLYHQNNGGNASWLWGIATGGFAYLFLMWMSSFVEEILFEELP